MFAQLEKYKEKEFFQNDNDIKIEVENDKVLTYKVFSVYVTDANDNYIKTSTGGHQNVVIGQVVVLVAVVQLHGAHRRGKHGQGHLLAEEIIAGVHGHVLADGVHVHAQLLPLLIVADEAGADSLGAGAGHGVLAGHAVAHGTGLAVGSHTGPRVGQDLLIGHGMYPPCERLPQDVELRRIASFFIEYRR